MLKSSARAINDQHQRRSCTTIDTHPCGWLLSNLLECWRLVSPFLNLMPNFKRNRQRYAIVVWCALHNFICINNRSDELFSTIGETIVEGSETNSKGSDDTGESTSSVTQRHIMEMSDTAKRLMAQFRDDITDAMWDDYVARDNWPFTLLQCRCYHFAT